MILLSIAHNDIDRGAHNEKFNVSEYELSRKMSYACQDELRVHGVPVMVYDIGPVNPHRGAKTRTVNLHDPQLAVEIHLNSADKPGNYALCLHNRGNENTFTVSNFICGALSKLKFIQHSKVVSIPELGYDTNRYWFITKTEPPAIIVEPAFINNDAHMEWLLSGDNLSLVGKEIGKAIALWAGRKSESSEAKSRRSLA